MKMRHLIVPGVLLAMLGCAAGERFDTARRPPVRTMREVYSMRSAAVGSPGLRAWEDAGRRSLHARLTIAPSFRERVRFPRGETHAVAYRLRLIRGQVVRVEVGSIEAEAGLFADMFHALGGDVFRPVHPVSESPQSWVYRAHADGEYVLRLQPPIERSGLYEIAVLGDVSLLFPVAGAGLSAIGGVFGDPRDGGARSHEGIDIFAPRGTPVIAVADGYIRQARNTPTGGLVIWQAAADSELTYYYAHLDELLVREGTRVRAGETIGTVGNTGNARTTPHHLHFGIYRPGTVALDPVPLLAATTSDINPIDGVTPALGEWSRLNAGSVPLRSAPSHEGPVIRELSADTPLLILGDAGEWQRVVLSDGTSGFIAARFAP